MCVLGGGLPFVFVCSSMIWLSFSSYIVVHYEAEVEE